jgi:hypothetical protein
MTLATRRQLLTGAAGVALEACIKPACLLQAQTQDVALPVSDAQIDVSAIDTIIGRGDRLARVPVTLSVPTDHTLVVEYVTQNGAGTHGALAGEAVGGAHFITTRGQLIFQPGERNKFAEIQLLKPLRDGQSILLRIADFGYPRRNYVSRIGRVTSSDSPPAGPRFGQDSVPLPSLPSGGSRVFSNRLLGTEFATDSGFLPDGRPCWQSRPSHGRRQDGNKELGYYADPALNPEATVWGVDPASGHRFIQAEYVEGGLADRDGGRLSPGWRKDIPFNYSAAMVTSRTLFNRITLGSYVEFDVKLERVPGSWPALWLKQANGTWPPEIDLLEAFISSPGYSAQVITSSIHWTSAKGHEGYGAAVPLSHLEPGADIFARFNRYGCYIGEKQILYYFNGSPYCAMPNLVGAGPWYMLMNVAVGGLVGEPKDPTAFPARMYIANVKVIQFQ